jgi:hypothetical protein
MLNARFKSLIVIAALAGLGNSTRALAQQSAMLGTPAGDIGVKLSDSSVLHVGVSAEAGYDTNVFYNDRAAQSSAMLRVTPSLLMTNNGRDGAPRSAVVYTLGANLTYREYLNSDENIRQQRAFVPSVVGTLAMNGQKTRLTLSDMFSRTEEPPYFATSETIKRDNNQGSATLAMSPGGGRLTFSLRYSNALDYFESGYSYASNMTHDGMLDASWKWLPKTAVFLQGGASFIHYLNPGAALPSPNLKRGDSTQVRGLLGLRGLITSRTTLGVGAGYATAFYPAGTASPSGLSNILGQVELGYMPTLLSRLDLTLLHGFRNSAVIGDFYDLDSATLSYKHSLGQLVASAQGAFEYRRYHHYLDAMGNEVPRKDTLLSAGASLDYYIQKWLFAGASYSVGLARQTDDVTGAAVPYTKQQVFARLGLAY